MALCWHLCCVVAAVSAAEGGMFVSGSSAAEGGMFVSISRRRRHVCQYQPPKAACLSVSAAEGGMFVSISRRSGISSVSHVVDDFIRRTDGGKFVPRTDGGCQFQVPVVLHSGL